MNNIILKGYSHSEDFLAEKLKKIFQLIENEEDRALHNDMIRDLQSMVGTESYSLRKEIARIIIQIGAKKDAEEKEKNTKSA